MLFLCFFHLLFSYAFYLLYNKTIQNNYFNVNNLQLCLQNSKTNKKYASTHNYPDKLNDIPNEDSTENSTENLTENQLVGNNKILTPKYRTVNLIKSITLGIISIPIIYFSINYDYNDYIYIIGFMGSIYSATDLSSMFFNKDIHNSTLIHHLLVQILYYYAVYFEWKYNTLAFSIYVYSVFSMFSYLVNGRLAIRNMNINKTTENIINDVSLLIYFICCFCNWSFQLYYLLFVPIVEPLYIKFIYSSLISMIMYDDIFLIKYLYKNSYYLKLLHH